MKRHISTIAAIVLAGMMAISCSTDEKLETLRQEIEEMRKAQEDLLKEQEDLLKEQESMRQEQANLQKEQDRMGNDIDRIGNDVGKLGADNAEVIGTIYENALVEQPAVYKGGEYEMMKYLADNLRYPESAKQQELQGRVIVKILIDKTGTVRDCEVYKGLSPDCDAEAKRLCMSMQPFTPAKHEGKNVSVKLSVPIHFRII